MCLGRGAAASAGSTQTAPPAAGEMHWRVHSRSAAQLTRLVPGANAVLFTLLGRRETVPEYTCSKAGCSWLGSGTGCIQASQPQPSRQGAGYPQESPPSPPHTPIHALAPKCDLNATQTRRGIKPAFAASPVFAALVCRVFFGVMNKRSPQRTLGMCRDGMVTANSF